MRLLESFGYFHWEFKWFSLLLVLRFTAFPPFLNFREHLKNKQTMSTKSVNLNPWWICHLFSAPYALHRKWNVHFKIGAFVESGFSAKIYIRVLRMGNYRTYQLFPFSHFERLYLVKHLNSYNCYVNTLSKNVEKCHGNRKWQKNKHTVAYGYSSTLTSQQQQ